MVESVGWRHPEVTEDVPPLTNWPVERPRQWLLQVNRPQAKEEWNRCKRPCNVGVPSEARLAAMTAQKLGLESTFHPRGRPKVTV